MKNVFKKMITGSLVLCMVLSMSIPVFAAEITPDQLPIDTTAEGYDGNIYEDDTGAPGSASTILKATFEAPKIKVRVDSAIRFSSDTNGLITNINSMDATNKGLAMVENLNPKGSLLVESLKVVPATGYSLVDFDSDFNNMFRGSKVFGLKVNGIKVPTSGIAFENNNPEDRITTTYDITKGEKVDEQEYDDYTFNYSAGSKDLASAFPIISYNSILPIEYEVKVPVASGVVTDEDIAIFVYRFSIR